MLSDNTQVSNTQANDALVEKRKKIIRYVIIGLIVAVVGYAAYRYFKK